MKHLKKEIKEAIEKLVKVTQEAAPDYKISEKSIHKAISGEEFCSYLTGWLLAKGYDIDDKIDLSKQT